MVTSHLRLVAKIAMGYRGYGLPLAEMISEGNVGLMQAVKKFDPDKGMQKAAPPAKPTPPSYTNVFGEYILEAAKEAGIRAGMHCLAPAYARDMLALGFDLVTMGTDVRLFTAAYAGAMAELKI